MCFIEDGPEWKEENMSKSLSKTFRKKLWHGAALYDGVYASLKDLRLVLPNPVPELTKKQAETLRHNIAVFAALHGRQWLKGIFEDLKEQA